MRRLRIRLTALAVLAVLVVLVAAGAGLVIVQRALLRESILDQTFDSDAARADALEDIGESTRALVVSLAVALPFVLLAVGVLAWWLVGRTLRPVEAAHRRQEQFVGDASHELRAPLARIRSELEVDAAHPETADLVRTHASVLRETIGLQRLVSDLLDLARGDAEAADREHSERVDLDDLVLRSVRRLRAERGITVDMSRVSAAQVTGDPEELARVVDNLLDNAERYATRTVTIELAEHDGHCVLAVADDGPGIPADQREAVFERFSRLDGARTTASGGSGLGLALVRDIVQRHGGTVFVDPQVQLGTRFVVRLPLRR